MVSSRIAGSHAYGPSQNNAALVSAKSLAVLALIVCSLQSTVSADLIFSSDQPDDISTSYKNFRRSKDIAAQQQNDALTARVRRQQETPVIEKISNFLFGEGTQSSAPTIDQWNYTRNGTDWNFTMCNMTKTQAQAPLNITNHDGYVGSSTRPAIHYVDWAASSFFSYLPAYKPVEVAMTTVKDYAYTLMLDKPTKGFNALFAGEPHEITQKVIQSQVRWEPTHLKFHYPAEHALNGEHAQVEMQVYHQDTQKMHHYCDAAVTVFFFNVSDTAVPNLAEPGNFFDWMKSGQENATQMVDLSIIAPKAAAQYTTIAGYVASDTVPPCTAKHCWYINEQVYRMTTEQYEKIKVKDVPYNARQMNLSPMTRYQSVLLYTGLFAEAPF